MCVFPRTTKAFHLQVCLLSPMLDASNIGYFCWFDLNHRSQVPVNRAFYNSNTRPLCSILFFECAKIGAHVVISMIHTDYASSLPWLWTMPHWKAICIIHKSGCPKWNTLQTRILMDTRASNKAHIILSSLQQCVSVEAKHKRESHLCHPIS